MRRKLLLALGVVSVIGVGAGSVFWSFQQPPDFYEEALRHEPPAEVRREVAQQVVERTLQLVEEIQHNSLWSEEFTEDEVNSWLAEEMDTIQGELPLRGIEEPRIRIMDGLIQLAFRVNQKRFQGIVSCELEPWISAPNQLAVAVRDVRIGLIPMSLQNALKEVSGESFLNGWTVRWGRAGGTEVITIALDRGKPVQPLLEAVELKDGLLRIKGTRGSLTGPLYPPAVRFAQD